MTVPICHARRRWAVPSVKWPRLHGISARDFKFFRAFFGDVKRPVLPAPAQPNPNDWPADRVTAAWIGHSTVLINFFGMTILTDPVFSTRAGISLGLIVVGPKRYVAPALSLKDLPPIDLVLLSHAHMDHFDLPSLRKFSKNTQAVTAHATIDLLRHTRLRHQARELAWGESARLTIKRTGLSFGGEVEVEAFQVNHWGARVRTDTFRGFNGYIIRRGGVAIIFAGDTANTPLFRKIHGRGAPERGGLYDFAIMPVGAYNPWITSHCTPEQAVAMADDAGARFVAPVHHQTFRLSSEPMDEPIERFEKRLANAPERVAWKRIGETFQLPIQRAA